ncbi:MAG TPA: metallophosphoesterase family protein [Dehalococcoidales bacterium]|nr:metallophosphoesterase family protein [Dehalococcoidales bacterium]
MRIAILSDIHGNLEALEAVLGDIDKKGGVDCYWCLGDTVDYGPEPHQCLERVRQLAAVTILGNHDAAVCGKVDYPKTFPADFVQVTTWTENHLTEEDKAYLAALPLRVETRGFTLVHASPREPFWEYMLDRERAEANLPFMETQNCLVGHTHVSACFEFESEVSTAGRIPFTRELDKKYFKDGKFSFEFKASDEPVIHLDGKRQIINPGAVGQQRTKDPRAAYAVYDEGLAIIELRRVEYEVAVTRRKMLESGLPEWLGNKLAAGS